MGTARYDCAVPMSDSKDGPLSGVRVVELAGIGPGPFCGMLLADLGAEVIVVDRPGGPPTPVQMRQRLPQPGQAADRRRPEASPRRRGRPAAGRRLRRPHRGIPARGRRTPRRRPRRLLGPQPAAGVRPDDRLGPRWTARAVRRARHRLHRGHRSAWRDRAGRGPAAGAGELPGRLRRRVDVPRARRGRRGPAGTRDGPRAGGGRCDRGRGGGAAGHDLRAAGRRRVGRPAGREPPRHRGAVLRRVRHGRRAAHGGRRARVRSSTREFVRLLFAPEGTPDDLPGQHDQARWPDLRERFAARFASRTHEEWTKIFDGTDACVAPVLTMSEAPGHPHLAARGTFSEAGGVAQPAPAPRFSESASGSIGALAPGRIARPGAHTRDVLAGLGFSDAEDLLSAGAVWQAPMA